MKFLPKLSTIRAKLVLGFAVAFAAMALFGALSYRYFVGIEDKLLFLSQAEAMVNAVLETRRYEKNYFLYGREEDYLQALTYLGNLDRLLSEEKERIGQIINAWTWQSYMLKSEKYRQHLTKAHQMLAGGMVMATSAALQAEVRSLRQSGQQLIQRAEELAAGERKSIQGRLQGYLPMLVIFLAGLGITGLSVVYLLTVRLVRPLYIVEQATGVVAQGAFRPIPWTPRNDEIGSLVQAFNHMVVHLRHNSEQMIQTEKLTALGTLTSGVAHELNNPLNNISTSCQILLEEIDDDASTYHKELLRAIDGQVVMARDIVSSLLEFARQREFELSPQNMRAVTEEALKLIRGEIPPGITMDLDMPPSIVAEMDKAHVVQALINLIMNGIQAMDDQGTLTIRGSLLPRTDEVMLEITDTGTGISPEVLPRIFDPFFTTKEVGRGTGLGLSITYGIVERHQGRIEVESKQGGGARFTVYLPLKARKVKQP